ncbi:TPA: hypothetical protein ACQXAA_000480, partial [Streptococcus pneumoniae]
NLFKPRQRRLTIYMLLTSSVLSTTSKQCFEQPAASFLVCFLIFIEYEYKKSHLANFKNKKRIISGVQKRDTMRLIDYKISCLFFSN